MTYEAFETIKIAIEGPLAIVTVSREAQLNALSTQVISELTAAIGELEISSEVRAVILTGAGDKAFVAGADIAEMRDLTPRLELDASLMDRARLPIERMLALS